MSSADHHPHPDPSATDTHGDDTELDRDALGYHGDRTSHDAGDDHGHGAPSEPLGPIDTVGWATAIGGAAIGIVVILALYLTIQA